MRNTIKAVLLSALVFPGTGHLSLKKPIQGWGLIGITVACLYTLFSAVLDISKDLGGQINSGEMEYNKEVVTELVTEKVAGGDYQFLSIAVLVLMACWVFGVIDSLRIGRKLDNYDANQKPF